MFLQKGMRNATLGYTQSSDKHLIKTYYACTYADL